MEKTQSWSFSTIIFLAIFYGLMLFVIFETFRTSSYAGLTLFVPATLLMMAYMERLQWNPMHRNPNFNAMDGTQSVIVEKPVPIHGGRYRTTIATKKYNVPDDKWYRDSGVKGFLGHISGTVSVVVEDKASKFIELKDVYCGAPEGAWLYLGSISGRPVYGVDQHLMAQVDFLEATLSKISTVVERAVSESAGEAKKGSENMLESMQKLSVIMKNFDFARREQMVMQQPAQQAMLARR